jgi:NADH dehydrogenase (ubiquinone) 1 beta subcomplex subunit 8
MWGPDVPVVPPQTALRQFTLVALGFVSFGLFMKYALVPDIPAVRREYPYSGLVTELGGVEENKVSCNMFRVISPSLARLSFVLL